MAKLNLPSSLKAEEPPKKKVYLFWPDGQCPTASDGDLAYILSQDIVARESDATHIAMWVKGIFKLVPNT